MEKAEDAKKFIFTFKPIVNSFFSKNISIEAFSPQRSSLPSNLREPDCDLEDGLKRVDFA